MKMNNSVESLVDSLVVLLSPCHLVQAAKGHHGIASDDFGCGMNYFDPNDPQSPNNRPGQVRFSTSGAAEGYDTVTSEDEYLRVLANTLRAKGATDAAQQIDEIRKGGRT